MLTMLLEVTFTKPKVWSKKLPYGRWAMPGNSTSLRTMFDIASYLTGCWLEVEENEVLYFDEPHTVVANFLVT